MSMNQAVSRDSDLLIELLARCALRDPKAMRELYQATSAKLFAIALAVVRREIFAEEILQEAYIKIWQAAESYNVTKGRPMTWMINIVRWTSRWRAGPRWNACDAVWSN